MDGYGEVNLPVMKLPPKKEKHVMLILFSDQKIVGYNTKVCFQNTSPLVAKLNDLFVNFIAELFNCLIFI